jgi:hypothetical protein
MTFRELLSDRVSNDPSEQHRVARVRFPDVARAHGMRLWRPGDSYTTIGERYLLGVAVFSTYDLELLDELSVRINDGRLTPNRLDLFDIDNILRQEDLELYIPGLHGFIQPPALGVWRDGIVQERSQGFHARQRLLGALGKAD